MIGIEVRPSGNGATIATLVASMIDWADENAAGGAKCWPLADGDGFACAYLFGFDRDDDATLFRLRFGIGGER